MELVYMSVYSKYPDKLKINVERQRRKQRQDKGLGPPLKLSLTRAREGGVGLRARLGGGSLEF